MLKQNRKITFRVCYQEQKLLAVQFLQALQVAEKEQIEKRIAGLFKNHGGFVIGYTGNEIVCLFGYQHVSQAGSDQPIAQAMVSLVAIRPDYQVLELIQPGLQVLIHHLANKGVRDVDFLAAVDDKYANKLYYPLARIAGLSENIWGVTSVLYTTSIEDVLAKLSARPHAKTRQYTGVSRRNVRQCLIV